MASRPMPWWKFSTGTRHHAKVTRLRGLLASKVADVYVYRLWDYCAEQRADGTFSGPSAAFEIALAVDFDGPPETILKALVGSGLMDVDGDTYTVHDWSDMQSALVRKFDADAARSAGRTRLHVVPNESPSAPETVPRGTSAVVSPDLKISKSPVSASPEGGSGETVRHAPEQPALLAAPEPRGPQPEDLQAIWNRLATPKGLPRWNGMSAKRRRDARLALRDAPDLAKWEGWLRQQLERPWNLGQHPNNQDWTANVEWLLRAKHRDLVNDFDPAVAARTSPGGDRPRLPPRESPPETTQPAASERRVTL